MRLVPFRLSGPTTPVDQETAEVVSRALERVRAQMPGVEHIRVHTSRVGVRGVAFCLASGVEEARRQCWWLCRAAIDQAAELHGWRVEV